MVDAEEREMNTIVVGYDGSEHAKHALQRAADMAEGGGTLVVLDAHPFRDPRPSLEPAATAKPLEWDVAESELKDRDATLAEAAESLQGRDLQTSYVLAMGDAANALIEAAAERHADLIVVGAHGHSFPERLTPSTVGLKLLASAGSDVLIVQ
jgi:nucleotide-binding universal stress UspA family protein